MKTTHSLLVLLLLPFPSFAYEFPAFTQSTVAGSNTGYPDGVSGQSQPVAGSLDLVAETLFFMKNLEFPDIGRTFIGYRAPLRFRYRAHDSLTLEAGVNLGHNYGDEDQLYATDPLVRLVFEPTQDVYVVAGSLISTHPIHDALFDDAYVYQQGAEQGLQLRVDGRRFKQDLWVNWKQRETATRPEKLDFGSVSQWRNGGFWLDGQLFGVHTGGQLNNPDNPVAHVVDLNIGLLVGGSYGWRFEQRLREIRVGAYYLFDSDKPDPDSAQDNSTASGVELRVNFDTRPTENTDLNVFASYYNGDALLIREGDPLYRNKEYAQLGTSALFKLPAGLQVNLGFTLHYYDDTFGHSEEIYFSWARAFNLANGI
jgi:hypothetical protein